MPVENLDSSLN